MSSLIDARVANVTADEFEAMVEAGVFGRRRVYLWGGRICEKRAKSTAHAFVDARILDAVGEILPPSWYAWVENPVRLGPKHVPLPDFSVVRGPLERYRHRKPEPADVGLIVEVAVTSLWLDLGKRAAHYARAGVPRYWVADAVGGRIVEHVGPRVVGKAAGYDSVVERAVGDEIEVVLDGVAVGRVALAAIF